MSDIELDDDVPFWAVSEFVCCDEECYLTLRCNGKRFYIIAEAHELNDKYGALKQQLVEMVQDESQHEELEGWVAEPLLPTMEKLAPTAPDSLTLAEFYNPSETFIFKLVSNDGKLSPVQLPENTDPCAYESPKIPLSELPTSYQKTKSLDASTITVIPMAGSEDFFGADTPSKVLADGNEMYHFKPVQDRHSFLREFDILSKLASKGLNQTLRVPTIHSLVYYASEHESIMGFLMDVIKFKDNLSFLLQFAEGTKPYQRQKWMSQIEDTVRQLHENDIIWGDVKPNNVLIDERDNVWLIDFGGGYNSEFVDENLIETVEGDLQGVLRMKKHLEV